MLSNIRPCSSAGMLLASQFLVFSIITHVPSAQVGAVTIQVAGVADDDCPFNASIAKKLGKTSPCENDACNTSNTKSGLTPACCSVVHAYCDPPVDPGCLDPHVIEIINEYCREDNDCPFNSSIAKKIGKTSPCDSEACNTSNTENGLTPACCSKIHIYCDPPVDPACMSPNVTELIDEYCHKDNDCPFNSSIAEKIGKTSPCESDACNTSNTENGLTPACCSVIHTYCDPPVDPACLSPNVTKLVHEYCKAPNTGPELVVEAPNHIVHGVSQLDDLQETSESQEPLEGETISL